MRKAVPMPPLADTFADLCREARVDLVTSVPDGYLVPLIEAVQTAGIPHVPAAREEECLGIAAGGTMCGKRVLIMMQNAGFLNSVSTFATLLVNYGIPTVFLVSHRGNIFDQNRYDTEKFRFFENFLRHSPVFSVSWQAHRTDGNLIKRAFDRAEAALEPTIISLDFAPTMELAC